MRSFWTTGPIPHDPTRIHPALTSSADECFSTLARPLAYVGVLALLAIVGIHLRDELRAGLASERPPKMGWSAAVRSVSSVRRHPFRFSLEKQRLTRFFGIPKAVARTSCAGRSKAKSRLQNSKSIAPEVNSTKRGPPSVE